MLTCKHVTRLLSEARDRHLSLGERIGLKLHLFMCSGCRHCGKQLDVLGVACQRLGGRESTEEKKHPTL